MIELTPYEPRHLFMLRPQDNQLAALQHVSAMHAVELAKHPSAAIMDGDEVLLCGGLVPMWEGRAVAWSYVSRDAGPHMTAVHRLTMAFLDEHAPRRTEMHVEAGFLAGHRWARMLGFELETPLARKFFPDGANAALFVRLR